MARHVGNLAHPAGWATCYEDGFQAICMGPFNGRNVFWGNCASGLQEGAIEIAGD